MTLDRRSFAMHPRTLPRRPIDSAPYPPALDWLLAFLLPPTPFDQIKEAIFVFLVLIELVCSLWVEVVEREESFGYLILCRRQREFDHRSYA